MAVSYRDYHNHFLDVFPFIHPNDLELYKAWETKSFEVQVANHELLGHGSGKLFKEDADGKKNFDPEKVMSLNLACICTQ
jgi:hypothetical protein